MPDVNVLLSFMTRWRGLPAVALASLLVAGLVLGLRSTGVMQGLEFWTYDQLIQQQPDEGPDPRILIVKVTENDLRNVGFPIPDRTLDQILAKIQSYRPQVIGLDIYRENPTDPGLLKRFATSDDLVAVTTLGNGSGVAAPPGMPLDRVAASDIPVDSAGVVRRGLFYLTPQDQPIFSLSLMLALHYLEAQGLTLDRDPTNPAHIKIGKSIFIPLDSQAGGYQNLDARGYQTLIHYRSATQVARQVSLGDILAGKVDPDEIKGRIVLLGITADSVRDLFYTPYSTGPDLRMPGVFIHAQLTSQILSAVLDDRPLIWFWTEFEEALWITLWALGGGLLAWQVRPVWLMALLGGVGVGLLGGMGWLLFAQAGWIPLIPAVLALLLSPLAGLVALSALPPSEFRPVDDEQTLLAPLNPINTVTHDLSAMSRSIDPQNRYRLERKLGSGGMGDVYLSLDSLVGKQVAIKILKANTQSRTDFRIRFEREVAICAALNSNNIVQVSDYGVTIEGNPFYVMEYLRGQSLGQVLKQERRLSVERSIAIVLQICNGLSLAHQGVVLMGEGEPIKVVHRDLKPDNIFLIPTGLGELVKVLDFGIVKVQNVPDQDSLTLTGQFLGTSRYAAPEQWEERPDLDHRADIYSLGVIFYEMLSGSNPFNFPPGKTTLAQWCQGHVFMEPTPIRQQAECGTISPKLEAIVMRCLAKTPEERFATVEDLSTALRS